VDRQDFEDGEKYCVLRWLPEFERLVDRGKFESDCFAASRKNIREIFDRMFF